MRWHRVGKKLGYENFVAIDGDPDARLSVIREGEVVAMALAPHPRLNEAPSVAIDIDARRLGVILSSYVFP